MTKLGSTLNRPSTHQLTQRHVETDILTVSIAGNPGSGKTSLIEATLHHLKLRQIPAGVIVAHFASARDAESLRGVGARVRSIDSAAPEEPGVPGLLKSLDRAVGPLDVVLLEHAGESAEMFGHRVPGCRRAVVFSVAGGDGKAEECPSWVADADVILLTKMDLIRDVQFDRQVFRRDVRNLNPRAKIIEVSSCTGTGLGEWVDWLASESALLKSNEDIYRMTPDRSEWWFG